MLQQILIQRKYMRESFISINIKMSQYQEKHETQMKTEENKDQLLVQEKSHNDTNVISVDTSEQFQHIDHSVSPQTSTEFHHLQNSQLSQSQQQQTLKHQSQPHEQDQTQQIKPQGSSQSKPAEVLSPIKDFKDEAELEKFISVKIFEKKINEALEFKNAGNEFFKTSQYNKAIEKYSEGLKLLQPQQFYGATQAECQKMAQVSASLLFNIGSCFFNVSAWSKAQIYYTQTITINPNHIKALYKRSLCRYELGKYDDAMSDIKLAFNKDKSNVEIHKSYEKILEKYNEKVKKDKEHLKEISSKMIRSESQKSLSLSQTIEKKEQQKKAEVEVQKEKEEQVQEEEKKEGEGSNIWGIAAPLLLLGGVALYHGFKKWFGK